MSAATMAAPVTEHELRYCPRCQLQVVTDDEERCQRCARPTLESRVPPKRRRRRRQDSRLSAAQLEAAYKLYRSGLSLNALGDRIWERFGYASRHSAAVALDKAFRREGWPLRDQRVATIAAATARRLPGSPGKSDNAAYQRWWRQLRGGSRRCAGHKVGAPGKGRPCKLYAQHDSDYCPQHDPERAAERKVQLAAMRERLGVTA